MACDLKKNKDAMQEAFEDVRSDSDNDWVVFGYEKDNRTLKVNETGEDGYDEMVDELGETKAVYAIIKLKDPNSGLPKMLQVNWLPDGLPAAVKAVVSRHVMDVERFFPGVHVRLNARYDDDVTEKVLLDRISKASGANYGIHKEKKKDYGPVAKTGTNYVKTDATKEVDVKKRNEYMNKQHQEDERRKEEDVKRQAADRAVADKERRAREDKEAAARNSTADRKAKEVQARKDAEVAERKREEEEARERWRAEQAEEAERMTEAEQSAEDDKKRQWEEERERISGCKSSTMTDEDREDAWQQEKERVWEEERERIRLQRAEQQCDDGQDEDEKRVAKAAAWEEERAAISAHVRTGHQQEEEAEPQQEYQEEPQQYQEEEQQYQEEPEQQEYQEEPQQQEYQEEALPSEPEAATGSGVTCRALYDYQAEDDTEVNIDPEEIITDVDQSDANWWVGTNSRGERGMFPSNYVEVCE
eukprot:scpid60937/ scgid8516/ Drebrin-like protein; Cervical SH3P7; Cervical mucin-associated protein; Drebrin-F; HPK1-interacting protein of 55 kDa; SH3 domain-containing protein 7